MSHTCQWFLFHRLCTWSNLVCNETYHSLPGGSKNNCRKEQTESLHETVLTATWKCARSLYCIFCPPKHTHTHFTLFPLFPRCDSFPSCPQNMSLPGRYARGLSPHVEKLAFKCFKYSREVCFWQMERACARVAGFQAEVLPPSGVLIFLQDSGGAEWRSADWRSSHLSPSDSPLVNFSSSEVTCVDRGWGNDKKVPQMIHLCHKQRI